MISYFFPSQGERMTQPTLAAVAMRAAVDQARKDRWLAKFKPIESPHGNYILPVVPSRVDFQ